MLPTLTARQQYLLQLPIVISEPAWLQAVYINDFLFAELSERLNAVLDAAYRAVLQEPDFGDSLPFGLWLTAASRSRDDHVWLNLQLQIVSQDEQPLLLRVVLADSPTSPT